MRRALLLHGCRYAADARRIQNRVVANSTISGEAAMRAELESALAEVSRVDREIAETEARRQHIERAHAEEVTARSAAEQRVAELTLRLTCAPLWSWKRLQESRVWVGRRWGGSGRAGCLL